MKKKLITFLSVLFIFGEINAQENCVSIDYTTKFIGKTIDLSYSLIKNKQDFSAGLVFYTNEKSEKHIILKRDFRLVRFILHR